MAAPLPAMPSGPWRLTLLTNPDDCNLSCSMCREHSPLAPASIRPPRRLPRAWAEKVLRDLEGTPLAEVIPSTTGEPLLWGALPELAELCRRRGLRLNVTTNGTWPRLGGAGWARLLADVCSDVKVSWNGATAASARALMGIDLEAASGELAAFVAARDRLRRDGRPACTVSLQVTAQEGNVAELPDIVRFAAELGLERVKVNQLQVHHPSMTGADLRRSPDSRRRWNEALPAVRQAAAAGPGRLRLQGDVEMDERGAPPPAGACPFLGREAWVTAEGRFAPCPAPAAKERRLGEFGSVIERPFAEIWTGAAYRALCATYTSSSICAGCPLRRPGGA